MSTAEDPGNDMTVAQLLKLAAKKGNETKTNTVTIDLPANPDILDMPIMITFSFGKDARNDMARLLNTFLEMEEDENG